MQTTIQTLALLPHGTTSIYAYLLVFLLAFLESLAFVGLTFPGTVLLILAGGFVIFNLYDFWLLVIVASLGGTLSNTLSYELSRRIRDYVRRKPKLWVQMERGQTFFRRYGRASVFLARMRGPVRSTAGVVAGTTGWRRPLFYLETVGAALSAAVIRLGLGYGAALCLRFAFLWVSRREGFLLGLLIIAIPLFFLWKWTIRRGRNALAVAFSLLKSGLHALAHHPAVAPWIRRYPGLNSFLRRHLTRTDFFGLPFTIIFFVMVYLLFTLWQVVIDEVSHGPLSILDTQVANLLLAFRNPLLLHFFYDITLLCYATILITLVLFLSAFFLVRRKHLFLFGLWIDMAISSLVVWSGKLLFHRLRPNDLYAAIHEATYSFPSAHATYGVALYGFIAYVCIRSRTISWRLKSSALFASLSVIFLIDMSRLYLGVHFLSDVIAGNLIGLFILLWSVSFAELIMRRRNHPPESRTLSRRNFVLLSLLSTLLVAGIVALSPEPAFLQTSPAHMQQTPTPIRNVLEAFDLQTSRFTETLEGTPQEPLNILVVAEDDVCLEQQFRNAGWHSADMLSPASLYNALGAAVLNAPYESAPMTPYFYDSEPHQFGFQKETDLRTIRTRHHVRFWKTNYRIAGGTLYVGTASFDRGLKWGGFILGLTHTIAADIDNEREIIAQDLRDAGLVIKSDTIPFVSPMTGKNFSGDEFTTDGRAAVLVLRSCPRS